RSLLEVQVGQKKVHHHAGWTPGSIAMPLQHVPKRNYILRIFERVIIVRIFTQMNSAGAKLLVPFTVAHPHAAPIIALQENQGTREPEVANLGPRAPCFPLVNEFGHSSRTDSP